MKKWILALLLIPTLCFGKGEEKTFPITNFSKGLDTYHSPLSLPDGYVQDSLNVLFDKTAPAEKRTGFTVAFTSGTNSYTGLWHYTDPTSTAWLIARTPTAIIANNNSTTVTIATVSASNTVNEVNALGSAYFVDQTQGVYYWNGTSTTYVTGSPKGSLIEQFHGRVWVAGQAIPNGNILNGSKYLDGTTWSTGINATDPVQFTIDLGDNYDVISTLYGSVNDTLYIFKQFSVSALYGFDQTDFQTRQLNREDGCVDSRSIQAFNKGLVLMGSKGVEFFDGYSFNRISDPVKNKVDGSVQRSFNSQSWTQSSQSDFQSGVSTPTNALSFTVSPGNVVLSTQVAFSTTDFNWAAGTMVQLDSTTNSPSLQLATGQTISTTTTNTTQSQGSNDGTLASTFFGGSNACSISACSTQTQWIAQSFTTDSNSNEVLNDVKVFLGSTGGGGNTTLHLKNDSSGSPGSDITTASILAASITPGGAYLTFSFSPISVSPNTKYWIYIDGVGSCSCGGVPTRPVLRADTWFAESGSPYAGGNSLTQNGQISTSNSFQFTADLTYTTYTPVTAFLTPGSFTSQIFNVGFSTNQYLWTWGNFSTTEVDNGQSITYLTQVSSSPTGPWDAPVAVLPSSPIASATKQYIQYIATFTTVNVNQSPVLVNASIGTSIMSIASGTYYSSVHNIPSMNSWGNFTTDDLSNGGTISYFTRASTSSFSIQSSTPAWIPQTKNSIVSASTGTFMQMSATFTITAATQTPTLNDFTFNWFSGSKSPPMASAVYDNRYWLSLTTNTADSQNDGTLVLSTNGIWSLLSIPAGGFTLSRGTLYHADANGTGNVYQDDQGYNDNGTAIDAYVRTKDYSIDTWVNDDFFYELWIAADNSGPYSLLTSYYVDGGTTSYTLSSAFENEMKGRLYLKLPIGIDSTHQDFASTISFKYEEPDNNGPWKFYGSYLFYKERVPQ